jgi:hypothetical protein
MYRNKTLYHKKFEKWKLIIIFITIFVHYFQDFHFVTYHSHYLFLLLLLILLNYYYYYYTNPSTKVL